MEDAYNLPTTTNLHLVTDAQVTGIDWSSQNVSGKAMASGLCYVNTRSGSNQTQHIRAREVVLSAGSVQSAQILELSGVGDRHATTPMADVGSFLASDPSFADLRVDEALKEEQAPSVR